MWTFNAVWTAIELAAAGIWAQIWHNGLTAGLLILCILAAVLGQAVPVIGPWLATTKKDFWYAAVVIGAFLCGQWLGAYDEKRKWQAREVIIEQKADTAVTHTQTPKARAKKDRWDRENF